MPWGLNDDIAEYRQERNEALAMLVDLMQGRKTADDAKKWLAENYPEMCPVCGANGQDESYCANCGAKLDRAPAPDEKKGGKACGNCHAPNQAGKFCAKCGKPMGNDGEREES